MVEKKHVVFDLRINYNGPLSIEKFYEEVEKWMNEKGLQKDLKRKSEDVNPKGKKIEWVIECWKALTTEHKHVVRLRALFDKIKEVKLKRKGHTVKINQADVLISIDGFLETSLTDRWTQKPTFFFLRALYDKYIWKIWSEKYDGGVSEDCYDLYKRLQTFFDSSKIEVG